MNFHQTWYSDGSKAVTRNLCLGVFSYPSFSFLTFYLPAFSTVYLLRFISGRVLTPNTPLVTALVLLNISAN